MYHTRISGKGFCFELARRGLNIVLVSRTTSKLQDVAAEIEQKYKVKTRIIAIDFTKDQNVQEKIESETKVQNFISYINLNTKCTLVGSCDWCAC